VSPEGEQPPPEGQRRPPQGQRRPPQGQRSPHRGRTRGQDEGARIQRAVRTPRLRTATQRCETCESRIKAREMSSRGDLPPQDCGPYRGLHVRRASVGFVPHSKAKPLSSDSLCLHRCTGVLSLCHVCVCLPLTPTIPAPAHSFPLTLSLCVSHAHPHAHALPRRRLPRRYGKHTHRRRKGPSCPAPPPARTGRCRRCRTR
jgi:hypothetical protein